MRLVAPNLLETATVLAAELDEDAAIALAEDARRRFPVGSTLGGCLGRHRILRNYSIFWIPKSILCISQGQWPPNPRRDRSDATSTSALQHAPWRLSATSGHC